jgi:hypothetical protein
MPLFENFNMQYDLVTNCLPLNRRHGKPDGHVKEEATPICKPCCRSFATPYMDCIAWVLVYCPPPQSAFCCDVIFKLDLHNNVIRTRNWTELANPKNAKPDQTGKKQKKMIDQKLHKIFKF